MTADGDRTLLAEALAHHLTDRDEYAGCAMRCGYDGDDRAEHLADALLAPGGAVAKIAAKLAAEELRAAGETSTFMWHGDYPVRAVSKAVLLGRAAALEAGAGA